MAAQRLGMVDMDQEFEGREGEAIGQIDDSRSLAVPAAAQNAGTLAAEGGIQPAFAHDAPGAHLVEDSVLHPQEQILDLLDAYLTRSQSERRLASQYSSRREHPLLGKLVITQDLACLFVELCDPDEPLTGSRVERLVRLAPAGDGSRGGVNSGCQCLTGYIGQCAETVKGLDREAVTRLLHQLHG